MQNDLLDLARGLETSEAETTAGSTAGEAVPQSVASSEWQEFRDEDGNLYAIQGQTGRIWERGADGVQHVIFDPHAPAAQENAPSAPQENSVPPSADAPPSGDGQSTGDGAAAVTSSGDSSTGDAPLTPAEQAVQGDLLNLVQVLQQNDPPVSGGSGEGPAPDMTFYPDGTADDGSGRIEGDDGGGAVGNDDGGAVLGGDDTGGYSEGEESGSFVGGDDGGGFVGDGDQGQYVGY